MAVSSYSCNISLTSQFYYCGLPLRLDAYSRCQFNCLYCFANARGGNRGPRNLVTANASAFRSKLERLKVNQPQSVIDEFLMHRQPIHFGGMSDPFLPAEMELKTTLKFLKVLADFQYPTVISTKGIIFEKDEYLDVLKRGRFVVQASINSTDVSLLKKTDKGTPGPSALLHGLSILRAEGIPTACRIQPLLPTREADAIAVIDACVEAGVRHVSVEHLKLPLEKSWPGTSKLSEVLGLDLPAYFASKGAHRVGREWVLPTEERLEQILFLRSYTHAKGLTFGAADNDLLLLSDGKCCCSGADLIEGFDNYFKYNYPEAARRGIDNDSISLNAIDDVWCPQRNISKFVNSHSRLVSSSSKGAGIREYIKHNWNGSRNGNSPTSMYGVVSMGEQDENGYKIYTFTKEMKRMMKDR